MSDERKNGLYWVRAGNNWSVADWQGEFNWWMTIGFDVPFRPGEEPFDEIGEPCVRNAPESVRQTPDESV